MEEYKLHSSLLQQVKMLNAQKINVNDTLLLLFWSLSCDQCQSAVEHFLRSYDRDIQKVLVHMPRSAKDTNVSELRRFLFNEKITIPVMLDHDTKLSNQLNVYLVPTLQLYHHCELMKSIAGEFCNRQMIKYMTKHKLF